MKQLLPLFLFLSITVTAQTPDLHSQLNMDRATTWPKSNLETIIDVCWENPQDWNTTERSWVKESIDQTWSRVANVRFTGWNACNRTSKGIRILIADDHPHTQGFGNMLNGVSNGMHLNFTFKNWPVYSPVKEAIKGIAAHEFGHALGFAHENMRSDCACGEESTAGAGTDGGYYLTPCDVNSIMNYCNEKWNNNGQLSDLDIEGVQTMYGKRIQELTAGVLYIEDILGSNALFENVMIKISQTSVSLHLDKNAIRDKVTVKFSQTGNFPYEVYSTTTSSNGTKIYGYGKGYFKLDANRVYRVQVAGQLGSNNKYKLSFNDVK